MSLDGVRVKVTIPEFYGTVVHHSDVDGYDYVDVKPEGPWPQDIEALEYVPVDYVSVEPEFWPPKIGEAWEADGEIYFVYRSSLTGSATVFPVEGNRLLSSFSDSNPSDTIDDFKALHPRRVFPTA